MRRTIQLRWCGRRDSNSHTSRRQNLNLVCLPIPPRPQTGFQTKTPDLSPAFSEKWGGRWVSNPRHQESQSCALPTELRPPLQHYRFKHPDQCALVRPAGLEPATTRLEGGCSIQLSYGRLVHIDRHTGGYLIMPALQAKASKTVEPDRLPNRNRCVCEAGRIILSEQNRVNAVAEIFVKIE